MPALASRLCSDGLRDEQGEWIDILPRKRHVWICQIRTSDGETAGSFERTIRFAQHLDGFGRREPANGTVAADAGPGVSGVRNASDRHQ